MFLFFPVPTAEPTPEPTAEPPMAVRQMFDQPSEGDSSVPTVIASTVAGVLFVILLCVAFVFIASKRRKTDNSEKLTHHPLSPENRLKRHTKIQFKMGRLIASGGFGRVYLGLDENTGTLMAAKEIAVGESAASDVLKTVAALKQEIEMMKKLRHPNIVEYYGADKRDTNFYILMEYLPGGTLRGVVDEYHGLPLPLIAEYTKQILSGLDYIHQQGVVHRDIKAANIMLSIDGVAKIGDFGSSRHFDTVTGMGGTPYWMSPEVIRGETVSWQADIWSLGCTVMELLTGNLPFSEVGTSYKVMYTLASSPDPMPIPNSITDIDARSFLTACLNRDVSQRPSAASLLEHPFVHDSKTSSAEPATTPCIEHKHAPPPAKKVEDVRSTPYRVITHPACNEHMHNTPIAVSGAIARRRMALMLNGNELDNERGNNKNNTGDDDSCVEINSTFVDIGTDTESLRRLSLNSMVEAAPSKDFLVQRVKEVCVGRGGFDHGTLVVDLDDKENDDAASTATTGHSCLQEVVRNPLLPPPSQTNVGGTESPDSGPADSTVVARRNEFFIGADCDETLEERQENTARAVFRFLL